MPQKTSPFLEGKYGWNFGESGWNTGADENWLKYSYMLDRNVDEIVSSLPAPVNGKAYFLTTDNRLYFVVDGVYYSSPTPIWSTISVKSTGQSYRFNGTSLISVLNNDEIQQDISDIQSVISGLGTASTKDETYFTTPSQVSSSISSALSSYAPGATSVNYNPATGVNRTLDSRLKDRYSAKDFGAVEDFSGTLALANETALRFAVDTLSSIGVSTGRVMTLVLDGHYILGSSSTQGANKSYIPPKSNVRIVDGTLKVKDSAPVGWNLIYPANDTDSSVFNFSVEDVIFNGNGPNNLNTTLQRNAMIGVLTGADITIKNNIFVNCPGFHIGTFGRDLFPATITRVVVEGNTVHNVASAISGNSGITDHSSFYMMGTECRVNKNFFYNDTNDTIGTAIELHGDGSSATHNYYRNYLNLVNLGGYISNVSNINISNNVGFNIQMCVRNYTRFSLVVDNIVIANNSLTVRTTSLSQFDFGGAAVENLLTGSVKFQNNFIRYVGADTVSPPPVFWIRGIKNLEISGNTVKDCNGWPILISTPATDAVLLIKDNNFDHPNNTATVSYASAVYIDNTTASWKILEVSNNTCRQARTYLLQAAPMATGGPIKVVNNTVTETPDLVSIPSTTGFIAGSVFIRHSGDLPSAGQFSSNYVKFAVGSEIQGPNGVVWKFKKAPGNGVWTREEYVVAMPTSGTYFSEDRAINISTTQIGTTPNKYVITEWRRLTNGSAHVLNTDWIELRSPTGT